MSDAILVNDLTKHFGSLTAVDHISFSVKKRRNLWIPWSERCGENNDDTNDHWYN